MMRSGVKEVEGRTVGRGLEGSVGVEGQQVEQQESAVEADEAEERDEVEGEGDEERYPEDGE